ncbi:serine/threonine-protein kinase 36-like isoform X3 [Mizuhopecten yessoensis]|uniref:serine/threonine-protein kinase 36-like isoform X3 n=1 Tax=Mizuhopecten yessoensis TaxID=6573 RepID=UPI000B45F8DD|nr:serine/threonine-protein kinase 36-like isoform X3 [Mizuhopecten yessoensis]
MDNYHVLEIIGEGSFGKVYKGRKKYKAQVVALKFIPKVGKPEKELRNLRREIDIMRGLHHSNIIEMLDSFETDKEVVVVTDYAEGELFQILEDDGNLPEEQVKMIACQLVSALYYLHSHRILHRDMKPQNILLGKGGIIKLCDFGFARAMSFNTLVLTSIKGTPLYMSPELVEEKPYDHTADLWALGCILYELFTGTPPFYTNSIFQLVSLIIKDPVKWPKNMTPVFKDFLQGLLTKNPKVRLSWPDLLHHPFVADGVNVREEDVNLPSPFTQPLTASMQIMKEKQAKEKAHPPGTSKILAKAKRKAMEEEKKKGTREIPGAEKYNNNGKEAWGDKPKKSGEGEDKQEQPDTGNGVKAAPTEGERPPSDAAWVNTGTSKRDEGLEIENLSPTPRTDRISKDYEKEYPSIEIEGRRTVRRSPEKKEKRKNIEKVKLEGEEVDSDDEWQGLIDATDQEGDPEVAMKLLKDQKFHGKLKTRIGNSSGQVLDGMLEGAARLRTVLRVVTNLVTIKCEVALILDFLKALSIPKQVLQLMTEILEKSKVKQQPWCQQILMDLVIALNAYFASEISWCDKLDKEVVQEYYDAMLQFMSVFPKLVSLPADEDLRLREQAVLCGMFTCEVMERNKLHLANQYFTQLSGKHMAAIDALLECTKPDAQILKKLTGSKLADGNGEAAAERMDTLIQIAVTTLSVMVTLPLTPDEGADGRRKVAHYLGDKLASKGTEQLTDEFLMLSRHPAHCTNVLKVIYACSQVSSVFCSYISNQLNHMDSLMGVLMGKVEVQDMEINSVIEMILHVFSTIVIQLQTLPQVLSESASVFVNIFLESTIASHTAAAALLFSQMIYCGVSVEVQPEEMLQACLSVFTDLQQICVRCPFDYGVLDGLLLLLCEMLAQAEGPVAQMYIDTGIWGTLWHRVAQALQVTNPETDTPIHDIEEEGGPVSGFHSPDWTLVSPQGLMAVLQMSVTVFTKETNQCIPNLAVPDSIILLTIAHLLNKDFLAAIVTSFDTEGVQLATDIILQVTQLCCFPFAIDLPDDLLTEVQSCLFTVNILPRLLHACNKYLKQAQMEMPLGLIVHLVLSSDDFMDRFIKSLKDLKALSFLSSCIQPSSQEAVICDVISLCNHLVRSSKDNYQLVKSVFHGTKGDYEPLSAMLRHRSGAVKSRACSLIGNLMKHHGQFYAILKQRDKILSGLIAGLKDEDPHIRKGASYAIGNAAFHNADLYAKLRPVIPVLMDLLRDPVSKTKANAASVFGNMSLHSNTLCSDLKKAKVVARLLDLACNDQHHSVQVSAILSLRSLTRMDDLKREMVSQKAVEKLNSITVANTPRPGSVASRPPSVMAVGVSFQSSYGSSSSNVYTHSSKLVRILQGHDKSNKA